MLIRLSISRSIVFEGMAKPTPCEPWIPAVFMPTTCPWLFSRGPPELPGLMGASVWMAFAIGKLPAVDSTMVLPMALTIPDVIEPDNPSGLPKAATKSPTLRLEELAI